MFSSFAGEKSYSLIYNLFTLAVSVFALTSLDSATRLCRYLFAELLTPAGKTHEDLTGAAKFFSTPIVSTLIMVIIGCGMGFMGLSQIWSVFGSANQLLAGVAMLAVCTWLLARQDRPQQQDVLLPDGIHACCYHHSSLLHHHHQLR